MLGFLFFFSLHTRDARFSHLTIAAKTHTQTHTATKPSVRGQALGRTHYNTHTTSHTAHTVSSG